MQKCIVFDEAIRILLIDVDQCLCFYVAHSKVSIRRCMDEEEDAEIESKSIFEQLRSAIYRKEESASVKVAKTELHIVGAGLTKATLDVVFRSAKARALHMTITLDGILGNAYLFAKAFQHWTHALIRMSLGQVRLTPTKLHLPFETNLPTLLASPLLQAEVNGAMPSSDTFPPEDADSDESGPLLLSSQRSSIVSTPAHAVAETTPNHLSPSKRGQEEQERLEAIELIKTGQQTTPQRTTRRSKAARF